MKLPDHIQNLKDFGVGDFTRPEIEEKVFAIKVLAEERLVPENPDISVVVPSFHEEKRILALLASLVQQTWQNCEFILVDNEPRPGNVSEIAQATEACKIVQEPLKGIANARQAGLEAARGRVVVSTDADTLHMPDWLASIAANFKDPKTALSIGRFYFMDQKKILEHTRTLFELYKQFVEQIITSRYISYRGSFGANSAFLRSVVQEDLSGYDRSLVFGEDTDIAERMRIQDPNLEEKTHDAVFTSARRFNEEGVFKAAKTSLKRRFFRGEFQVNQRAGIYKDYR